MEDDVQEAVKAATLQHLRERFSQDAELMAMIREESMRAGFSREESMAMCLELLRLYYGPKAIKPKPQER